MDRLPRFGVNWKRPVLSPAYVQSRYSGSSLSCNQGLRHFGHFERYHVIVTDKIVRQTCNLDDALLIQVVIERLVVVARSRMTDGAGFRLGSRRKVRPLSPGLLGPGSAGGASSPVHPMKSNGTTRKIEHIKTSTFLDIDPSCFCG